MKKLILRKCAMRFSRFALCAAFASGCAVAYSQTRQTPPTQITTPDVKIPGPLSLPGPAQVEIGSKPLSIEEAVVLALRKQPLVGIAKANLLSAQGRTDQAASGLFPQLGASSAYNDQKDIKGSSSSSGSNRFTGGLSVQQLLFDFGRTRDQVRQQSLLQRFFSRTLTRTQQTVSLQVKQAFYDLYQNQANVVINEANVSNRQRQLDQAQARELSGLGSPSDVVQAKTNLADAAITLSTARNLALTSQVVLAQLLGIDSRTPITPAASKESALTDEADLQKLVNSALSQRPDILAAQDQTDSARYAISAAQKGDLPRVTALAGLNGRGPNDPFAAQTASFGISVSWSFGDGGLTSGRVKEAKGVEEAARQTLVQVTDQALSEVSQAFVDLQSAVERVGLAEVGVANALELVRISEGRYVGGIGLFLDVTNAQSALFTAQRSLTQAQADVQRTRARLRTAIGLS